MLHLFRDFHVSRALAFASKWSLRTSSLVGNSPKEIVRNMLSIIGGNDGYLDVLIKVCFLLSVWMLGMGWCLVVCGILN